MIELALYQPDIPQNTATILRMAACLGLRVHIIEPAGFAWSKASFRRAGMDYLDKVDAVRDESFATFMDSLAGHRLVLATTRGGVDYTRFEFASSDVIMFGRESAGVPQSVHEQMDWRIRIPLKAGMRSLNIAVAAAMITGEALRQTKGWP